MPTLRDLTEYHKPTDLDKAVKLLRRRKVRTVPLGGGSDLVSTAPLNIQAVVDLGALGLSYIKPIALPPDDKPADDGLSPAGSGSALEIGATTTLQTLVDDAQVRAYAGGLLVKAILDTASRNVRETATLAGSIIAADGKTPLLAALFALDAQVTVRGARTQIVPLAEFGPQDGTFIEAVTLPSLPDGAHATYEKVARTPADLPIVCVAAVQAGEEVRLTLGGVGSQMVLIEAESPTVDEAVELAQASVTPPTDYFASAEYRREMIGVLVRRCLT